MTRVALVHERLTELGGSEKVVDEFARIWPDARLFVPIADPTVPPEALARLPRTVSPLQRLYRGGGGYSHLLPLLPWAMAHADFSDVDLVVASHHAFSNRIRVPEGIPLLSYVHSPARWMWDAELRSLELGSGPAKTALGLFARSQRGADRRSAARATRLVANSATVAARIADWWGRDADVVHPPVDVEFFRPDPTIEREDFILLAGRLVPYKRPELAVAAATRAGVPLVVAGQGRAEAACRAVAGADVRFLGEVSDGDLLDLFRRCRALVFPGVEDFGMVPVEAQACGAPVVGVNAGGLRETVVDGVTGVLVPMSRDAERQTAELAGALADGLDALRADPDVIRKHAEGFSADVFHGRIEAIASELLVR